jgi:hypothetical protein
VNAQDIPNKSLQQSGQRQTSISHQFMRKTQKSYLGQTGHLANELFDIPRVADGLEVSWTIVYQSPTLPVQGRDCGGS